MRTVCCQNPPIFCTSMPVSVTDTLCTQCGLCCDGSLFSDVELSSKREISRFEVLGLNVEDGDGASPGLLLQPCTALQGKRCSIYEHRPKCCRTFECGLLKRVKSGAVSVEVALGKITTVTQAIAKLRTTLAVGAKLSDLPLKECYLERMTLIAEQKTGALLDGKVSEANRQMELLEALIQETFLQ
jgi:hypothetical protein